MNKSSPTIVMKMKSMCSTLWLSAIILKPFFS